MGIISKNFSFYEFTYSEIARERGINNEIESFEVADNITALVNNVLQPLRDAIGKKLKINSGYRSRALNNAVKGVFNSQHTKGEASDLATGNAKESYCMAKKIVELSLPFDQIILYPTFVHVSHSRVKNRGQILYNWRYKGQKL